MQAEKWMRGTVKTVFILCYVAFMIASIRHVATFFNNFEPNNDDPAGSYALAGAFDITALVTTIGVMFFRKSMPRWVFGIIWTFILVIAGYSFFINWEYASHYQDMSLLLQPTGQTTPIYDAQGILHYVPVMAVNTGLVWVNPLLASGFTIFSLIYSVIAEFFGTKAPSAQELQTRKQYLEETAPLQEEIRKLEEKGKKPGLIQRGKQKALELKDAVKEVTKKEETTEEPATKPERNTGKLTSIASGNVERKATGKSEESQEKEAKHLALSPEESLVASAYEKAVSWLSDGSSTVSLDAVVETTNLSRKMLNSKVANHQIRATKNKGIVYKNSLVSWIISEVIAKESQRKPRLKLVGKDEESPEHFGLIEQAMLRAIQQATDEERDEIQALARTKSLSDLTGILQQRYPQYAAYITETRVSGVMAALTVPGASRVV